MGKIAVLFSGQGAQSPGMMKDITEYCERSKAVFDMADSILGRNISTLSFEGTQEELNLTHNTQPCMIAAELAAYEALNELGITPDAVAGFSLGEYAALVAAGCIEMEDVFPIIQKRADYMQEAVPVGEGAMAAIGGKSLEEVQCMCKAVDGYVVPANINCPGQIVVSGETDAVRKLVENARDNKIKAMLLPVSAPFHCDLLKSAADNLAKELDKIDIKDPSAMVFLNVDGEKEQIGTRIKDKIILQAKSPVYWEKTLINMYNEGVRIFIECGPGKTLSGFVKKTFKGYEDIIILRVSDLETLQKTADFFKESF